jgi:hypothetical protein
MTSIRSLDPVDPDTAPPDGSRLLNTVVATPRRSAPRSRAVGLVLQLAPIGIVVAFAAGVVLVLAGGGGSDEQEAITGSSGGDAIAHYVVRERVGGDPAFTHEHWQLEDGSRARTVSHWEGPGPLRGKTSEEVVTSTQTLNYLPSSGQGSAKIIRYRASDDFAAIPEDPPSFAAPPIGGSPEVGDPRTVPDRLAAGDKAVQRLADTTIRGIAVEQFQVGRCPRSKGAELRDGAIRRLPQYAIVALARDSLVPVRVSMKVCDRGPATSLETTSLDYLSFEELPATPENLKLLDMSPHPGVPVRDGITTDLAEKHEKPGPAATPTPAGP